MTAERIEKLLKIYKRHCDLNGHDYEFHYASDIENNEGALEELKSYIFESTFLIG